MKLEYYATCTDLMFIYAEVDVYKVFFISILLWCASFEILGGFMKYGVRNKQPKKGSKWRFSSCWFSLICTQPYIFHSFVRTI